MINVCIIPRVDIHVMVAHFENIRSHGIVHFKMVNLSFVSFTSVKTMQTKTFQELSYA